MTDDSEDIFLRAAENYPLKTDNPDWDAVHKKMEDGEAAQEDRPVSKKKNKLWPLLLLLVSLAVIEYKYSPVTNLFSKDKHAETQKMTLTAAASRPTEQVTGPATTENNTTENKVRSTDAVTIDKTPAPVKDLNIMNTPTVEPAVANTTNPTTITVKAQTASLTHSPADKHFIHAKHNTTTKENKTGFANNGTEENTTVARHSRRITSKQKSKLTIKNGAATGDDDENKVASAEKMGSQEKITTAVTEPEASNIPADTGKSVAKEEPAVKQTVQDSAKTIEKEVAKEIIKTTGKTAGKDKKTKKPREKHFYIGLMAGPDFSEIKMQSVKKMGVSFGLIAGYSINKKLSIETGFFKDEKKYCSDGKYFSTKKIVTYPNSTITYVSGTCYMYEIPLNVRYTFIQKKRSTLFANAGISSYLMSKESYDYDVKYYNTIYPYSKEYKSKDNQLAAVINISAGYTHKLGKIGDVRIEPYVKLPVNKVGTGDLPIQSFGIMFGIMRKLF